MLTSANARRLDPIIRAEGSMSRAASIQRKGDSATDPHRFLLSQLPRALVLHIYFQSADAIRLGLRRLHVNQAGENGNLNIEADVRTAFGEGFVMRRALRHLSDVLHFTLPLAVAVR